MLKKIFEGDSIFTVIDPATVIGRGRPQESTKFYSQKSTQRDLSAFGYVITEFAASGTAAGRKRNCDESHEEGHIIRACPVRRQILF